MTTASQAPSKSKTPIPLFRTIDSDALSHENPCDDVRVLGSFWPNSRGSFESHVVKGFKECCPVSEFEPHISSLSKFYAELIRAAVHGEKFSHVVRVLSSSEAQIDRTRPQSTLVDNVCRLTGATDVSHIFFKTGARPPMRVVNHLAGPEALRTRISYAAQDLFIRPTELTRSVLVLDDIMNTGASMRVYAHAVKKYCGATRVVSVNLAATRFNKGRDGHGLLKLDVSRLENELGLRRAWLDANEVCHLDESCDRIVRPVSVEMRFMVERKGAKCLSCCTVEPQQRKWWQIWLRD